MLTEFTVHRLSYSLMHFLAWFIGIFIYTFNSQREGTQFLPCIMLKAAGFHVITTTTEIELIESFKKRVSDCRNYTETFTRVWQRQRQLQRTLNSDKGHFSSILRIMVSIYM